MAEGSVECANCGRANPAWATVCRSCGAPMHPAAADPATAPAVDRSVAGVDQGSLIAIGAALGTIVAAIVIGMLVGGILPPAPPIAAATPSPSASAEPTPAPTPNPSASAGSPGPSLTPGPVLPGTLTFGLGLNTETQRVTNPTDTFTAGTTFAHSVELTTPFGVTQIGEGVSRVNEDRTETLVINEADNVITGINPNALVDGFTVETNALLDALGPGTYVMRVYRGSELLAEGTFILVE